MGLVPWLPWLTRSGHQLWGLAEDWQNGGPFWITQNLGYQKNYPGLGKGCNMECGRDYLGRVARSSVLRDLHPKKKGPNSALQPAQAACCGHLSAGCRMVKCRYGYEETATPCVDPNSGALEDIGDTRRLCAQHNMPTSHQVWIQYQRQEGMWKAATLQHT